mgnify:CR=1 FL=1
MSCGHIVTNGLMMVIFGYVDGMAWKEENKDFEPSWKIYCSYNQHIETRNGMVNCCIGITKILHVMKIGFFENWNFH